jgi:CDP-glucose 4,6-dehydratase
MYKFFQGKNVFVTGHTGFKGAWAAFILKQMGANVTGFALKPAEPSLFTILDLEKEIASIFGDINNPEEIEEAIKNAKPEIIFHMAAQAFVIPSYKDPRNTWQTNVIGTLNVFEGARKVKTVKAIVNVTTDKCYENMETIYPYKETDKLGGHDPYSSSKAAVEILSASYRKSFLRAEGIKMATARAGNVIGGGDFSEIRLIPNSIRSVLEQKPFYITAPNSIRPWQHVMEALNGYFILCKKLYMEEGFDEAFNFGPDVKDNLTVLKVITELQKYISSLKYEIKTDENALHEAKLLMLDTTYAKQRLLWKPKTDIFEGIKLTAEWYMEYITKSANLKDFTKKQIEKFYIWQDS